MKTVEVKAARPYPVHIGGGLLGQAGAYAARLGETARALALVADETVMGLYGEAAAESFSRAGFRVESYSFPPGEGSKNAEQLFRLLEFLAEREFGRGDLLAALGGGVTGDLGGFAAAVYQRGMAYLQLPTTLLAAVDSSVGGKTAVNLCAGKNLAGAFWQPSLVLCDCDTFSTLSAADRAAGAAECVKYGMLGDPKLLDSLCADGLNAAWEEIVPACVRQKAALVERDEREAGCRRLLNLGHTVGHAAERLSGYSLRHGEGVAMGMAVITRAARRLGFCAPDAETRLFAALRALGLPLSCPYPPEALARAALGDKKRRGDEITLVLPRAVGDCVLHTVKTAELLELIRMGMEA